MQPGYKAGKKRGKYQITHSEKKCDYKKDELCHFYSSQQRTLHTGK